MVNEKKNVKSVVLYKSVFCYGDFVKKVMNEKLIEDGNKLKSLYSEIVGLNCSNVNRVIGRLEREGLINFLSKELKISESELRNLNKKIIEKVGGNSKKRIFEYEIVK